MAESAFSPEIGILSPAAGDGRHFDSEPLLRDYLGFGTGFALGALVFFFAALAFCFCAACLCVALGDLSPMNRRVRFLTIGVNTDRHRSDEISDRPVPLFTKALAPVFRAMSCFSWFASYAFLMMGQNGDANVDVATNGIGIGADFVCRSNQLFGLFLVHSFDGDLKRGG